MNAETGVMPVIRVFSCTQKECRQRAFTNNAIYNHIKMNYLIKKPSSFQIIDEVSVEIKKN